MSMSMTSNLWRVALTTCAVLALTAPTAHAETSAAKKELIAKVVQLQIPVVEAFARFTVEQPAAQLMQAAGRELQAQPAEKREAIGRAIEADVKKYIDEVAPVVRKKALESAPKALGPVLDEKLSEDELKILVAWLESPVSRKFEQVQSGEQRAMGEALMAETRSIMEPKLKALQQSMAQKLGVSTSSAAPAASGSKAATKK
jgi:uncharacterized protein